jgi:predicted HNH restriction endonuclease
LIKWRIAVHHKDNYKDFPAKRIDPDNGVTLCENCHTSFHKEAGYKGTTEETFLKWLYENTP